jgi:hypothetical protein
MSDLDKKKILEVIRLCNEKITDQKNHEAKAGYGEDYTDGRIVGSAALARRILVILQSIQI